jgi:spore coat polysaccharide biosynthesis protein SpsF
VITAIIQARMGSTRLPGKVMRLAAGKPLLQHVVERVKVCQGVSQIIVATTDFAEDLEIVNWCCAHNVTCYPWNRKLSNGKNDVLGRFYYASQFAHNNIIMRVTADCPLWCPLLGQEVIDTYVTATREADFFDGIIASNVRPDVDGFDTEIFNRSTLIDAQRLAVENYDREHVTPWLYRNKLRVGVSHANKVGGAKLSVDTEENFQRVRWILERVENYSWREAMRAHLQTAKT